MKNYAEILNQHGYKSHGDDLVGFHIYMDYGLEDEFEWVETKEVSNSDYMLIATCKIRENETIDKAKKNIVHIFNDYLKYETFNDYRFIDIEQGFEFCFVTYAPHLGVTGKIRCIK